MTVATPVAQPGGGRLPPPGASRRKDLTFDKVSFMLVFLGVPLVGYVDLRGLAVHPGGLLLPDRLVRLHRRDELHRVRQLREAASRTTPS